MKNNTGLELQAMNQLKNCIMELGKKDMTEYEILSFIQTFLFNIPNSIDPLANEFSPIFPAFKVPIDIMQVSNKSVLSELKGYDDTKRVASAIRLYADLQYKLLMGDYKVSTIGEKEKIDRNQIEKVTKCAKDILGSKKLSERLKNVEEANESIKDMTGIWSPFDDIDIYCFQSRKKYNKEMNIYGYLAKEKIKVPNNKN